MKEQTSIKTGNEKRKAGGGGGRYVLIASFVVAVVICGVVYYFYRQAKSERETEEYLYAMGSKEPAVAENYLSLFADAPQEHRDSVLAHLDALKTTEDEWREVATTDGRSAAVAATRIADFLRRHPDTRHRKEALELIDSLDFIVCREKDTEEAYSTYLKEHEDGNYYDQAQEGLRVQRVKNVTAEERSMVSNVFYTLLTAINTRDEARLLSVVAESLVLLDKTDATKSDVAEMLNRLYKEGVTSVTWHDNGDYNIRKRDIGVESYEYGVSFTMSCRTEHSDGRTTTAAMRVNAVVNPDALISELRLTRMAE